METKIPIFKNKQIRKTIHNNEWWFSVVDICGALAESLDPGAYWRKLKQRLIEEGSEVVTFCHGLKLEASDGKSYETDCSNTEGVFRIIQSIPSPKAEPFKRWLAKVGYERVQEIEDPELATKRTRMLYKLKGYPEDWIEKRMRGIAIRKELTDEWQKRGARENKDYEILTAEIHKVENSQGLPKLQSDANRGGSIAGGARKQLEKELGRTVVSKKNFLKKSPPKQKKLPGTN